MKLTKRILCLALMLALAVTLCACGNKKDKQNNSGDNGGVTTTTTADDWAANMDDNLFNDGELDWG